MTSVAVVGAGGYTGGELVRLLLGHADVELVAATSDRHAGQSLHRAHPNLRGATDLRFAAHAALPDSDVVFTCVPHGTAQRIVPLLLDSGRTVIDLSADFRLRDAAVYAAWYGTAHASPDVLAEAVYGLCETQRIRLAESPRLVSGVGCLATAMNLALLPLARAGLLQGARVVVDGKIGSSAGGAGAGGTAGARGAAGDAGDAGLDASTHAARSRSLRLYAPTSHRHAAEVAQELGVAPPDVSVHAVELVRGVLATCHVLLPDGTDAPDEKTLWRVWRDAYAAEPFVRIVKERQGVHRGPDPKLVAGSNFADVSFHVADAPGLASGLPGARAGPRIVATCALDNLVKGAAGSAVQAFNVVHGLAETTGLTQLPVHPQ